MKILITKEKVEMGKLIKPEIIHEEDLGDAENILCIELLSGLKCLHVKTKDGQFRYGMELKHEKN